MLNKEEEFQELLMKLRVKLDRLACFGLVGEVFEDFCKKVWKLDSSREKDMTHDEAALIVGLIFAQMEGVMLDEVRIAKHLEEIRRNDEAIHDLMRRLQINPLPFKQI